MLILLRFKCHWFVSCSISKVSQFVSACSAKSPSQGLCVFPIVISALATAPGTVSSTFIWAHHSEFSTVLCHLSSSTVPNANSLVSLSKPFTIQSCLIPVLVFVILPPTLALSIAPSVFGFSILRFPWWLETKTCSETSKVPAVESFTMSLSRTT